MQVRMRSSLLRRMVGKSFGFVEATGTITTQRKPGSSQWRAIRRRSSTLAQGGYTEASRVEEEMKYAVLYAPTATGYSAHVPDLPGCIGAAATLDDTRILMKEANRSRGVDCATHQR